jgi:hypothetical protein
MESQGMGFWEGQEVSKFLLKGLCDETEKKRQQKTNENKTETKW